MRRRRRSVARRCGRPMVRWQRLYGGWRERADRGAGAAGGGDRFLRRGRCRARCRGDVAGRESTALHDAIARHLDDGHRGELVRDGFQVVLAGAPNSGKSSLLNALARRDVAIVSDEAGTTRDIIEVKLDLEGLPVVVSDTAGIREAAGKVEQEGIRRALQRAEQADLVVWLVDATCEGAALAPPVRRQDRDGRGAGTLVVLSKSDLVDADRQPAGRGSDPCVGGHRRGDRCADRAAGRRGPCPHRVRRGAGPDAGTAPPPSRAMPGVAPCGACSAGGRQRARGRGPAARGGRARSRDRRSRCRGRAGRGVRRASASASEVAADGRCFT